jgi:hypothetical protein
VQGDAGHQGEQGDGQEKSNWRKGARGGEEELGVVVPKEMPMLLLDSNR